MSFDPTRVPSPSFVIDIQALKKNLAILEGIKKESGARILLAQKAFAAFSLYPLIAESLDGVCASGYNEVRLGQEEFGKSVHCYAPAYSQEDFARIFPLCDHIVFNSFGQWQQFRKCLEGTKVKAGFRVNPQNPEAAVAIYDPSSPLSRLGIPLDKISTLDFSGITGIHFHNLCEQNLEPLERTLAIIEKKMGNLLFQMQWMNWGGGHHITRDDYNRKGLVQLIKYFSEKYNLQIILEPGEAVALNAGYYVSTVLDIIENGGMVAILDGSTPCHLPDVLEMPYRPEIKGAGLPGEKSHDYRLAGVSCLAGDVVGDYSFDWELKPGDKLVFKDMAHYTMVKTNTFNGVPLPAICSYDSMTEEYRVIRKFNYDDFKMRLS